MDEQAGITQAPGRRGRPKVGLNFSICMPAWVIGQINALQALHGPKTPLAGVLRDAVVAGLLSLKAAGVEAPGFDPGAALLEAQRRGEPTGLLKRADVT